MSVEYNFFYSHMILNFIKHLVCLPSFVDPTFRKNLYVSRYEVFFCLLLVLHVRIRTLLANMGYYSSQEIVITPANSHRRYVIYQ